MDEHEDLQRRLRAMGSQPIDPARASADLAAMAAVRPVRAGAGGLRPKVRLAAAFLAGLMVGGTGLAAADALPDPAQHVAHEVLGSVGVDVPDPERYHGPECGAEVQRNHGGYVSQDHSLAQSDCGKPVRATGKGANKGAKDGDSCHGRPSWAGTSMTPEERAAAQAEREATCPDDDESEEPESQEQEVTTTTAAPEETTTTEAPTTTTAAPTTTTTESETTTTAA